MMFHYTPKKSGSGRGGAIEVIVVFSHSKEVINNSRMVAD